jgi:hypothetical protein
MADPLPPLPGVATLGAPTPDDLGYVDWLECVAISPEGVDRMLIWENLHRTPTERLEVLERTVNDLLELRGGRWPEGSQ